MNIILVMSLVLIGPWTEEPGDLIFTPQRGWEERPPAPKGTFDYDFYAARDLCDKADFRAALNIFRTLASRTKDPSEKALALFWQGECLLAMARPTEALILYETLTREFPGIIPNAQIEQQEYKIALRLARDEERRSLSRPFYSPRKKGLEILEKIASRGPSSPLGDDAQMAIFEYYIEKENYLEAELAYEKLTQVYPRSELIPLARFEKIKLLLQEWQGSPNDIDLLNQAEREAKRLSQDPRGLAFAQRIEQILKDITEIRAERDYQTAQFYLRRGKLEAALIYLKAVSRDAPETSWAKHAKAQMEIIGQP